LLVIGFGNELRRDDGVGLAAIRELRQMGRHLFGVDLIEGGVRGIDLLDLLEQYDRAIVVDAFTGGDGPPGEIVEAGLEEAKFLLRPLASLHNLDLGTAFALGRALDLDLPPVEFVLMRVADVGTGEGLTEAVRLALPALVRRLDARIAANTRRTGAAN
jgi:hydrogenase maturation protease